MEANNTTTLPGGIMVDGVLAKEAEYREMTGNDEENIANPNIGRNGAKLINVLLMGTVPVVGGKPATEAVFKDMLTGDRDFLLIQVRRASFGDFHEMKVKCPVCGNKFTVRLDLSKLPVKSHESIADRTIKVEVEKGYINGEGKRITSFTMKLPTGVEQELLVQTQNSGAATTTLLTRCCTDVGMTSGIMKSLTSKDRRTLAKAMSDAMPGYDMSIKHTCPDASCQHEWETSLSIVELFTQG